MTHYSVTTASPQPCPSDTWTVLEWNGQRRFSLPAGKADLTLHLSVDIPKAVITTRPVRIIVGRVRYRDGVKDPTARDSLLVPVIPAIVPTWSYIPWIWSDLDTEITEGEEWEFELHHNAGVPLSISKPAAKGRSLVPFVADRLRVVPR